ncbi:MAG TPA: hypothetical protein VGK73_38760 [Polyangiaceae bacterium]
MLAVAPPYRNPFGYVLAGGIVAVIVIGGSLIIAAIKAQDYLPGKPGEKGRGS